MKKTGEYRQCRICNEEFYIKRFALERGNKTRGKCCSMKCLRKYQKTEEFSSNVSRSVRNNKKEPDIRRGWRNRRWRQKIKEKFKECQECGEKDKKLHAHHLIPISIDPEKAYDQDNGILLCENCHMTRERADRFWSTSKK
jgi:5-methylcytosine-specific restriction endonuclease McrA